MEWRNSWNVAVVLVAIGMVGAALIGGSGLVQASERERGHETLTVYANMVAGGASNPAPVGGVCVETNRFRLGQQVVWRIRVLDEDGVPLDDTKLKSVVVKLPNGQQFPARFGGHPGGPTPTDHFWSASWKIPADAPTGSLPYEVVATALHGNRVGTFKDFNVAPSLFTIVP